MRVVNVLPIAFAFAGAISLFDRWYSEELSRLAKIRSEFTSAIGETKGQLSRLSWSALTDSLIDKNIEIGNFNTVTQSLQNYIRPGELTQMDVLDDNCQVMVRLPQNSKPVLDICEIVKKGKPALHWARNDQGDGELVSVVVRDISGRKIFLVSAVTFDQAWLSLHPHLSTLILKRQLVLSPGSSGAVLWKEGSLNDGVPALSLSVDGWIYRFAPEIATISLESTGDSYWILYFGIFGLILLAWVQAVSWSQNDSRNRQILSEWIHKTHGLKSGLKREPQEVLKWVEIVHLSKKLIADRSEQLGHQIRLMKERLDHTSSMLRERDLVIDELENRISGMSHLASLQVQIQHSTVSFLRQMSGMRETCETIYDLSTSGLAQQAKGLHAFVARWRQGLSQGSNPEMTARKFFKHLVETPGNTPGRTKLDDELADLERMTSYTLDQSINATILARQAISDCEAAEKMASLWHAIAMKDQSEKTADWCRCISMAQRLVNAHDRFQMLTFESLPQMQNYKEFYPVVSETALVSGLFHLYLALLQDVNVANIEHPIMIRQKKFNDHATIILALPRRQLKSGLESPSRKMLHHLELAQQIFAVCQIKADFLPQTAESFPISLTWRVPKEEVEVLAHEEFKS